MINNIIIPEVTEGRKIGKFLIKKYKISKEMSDEVGKAIKEKYEIIVADEKNIGNIMTSCHSCMSRIPKKYLEFWNFAGCEIIALVKNNATGSCEALARTIINKSKKAFSQCYGEKHFILEEMLKFNGYNEGDLITISEAEKIVSEVFKTDGSLEPPKSKIIEKTLSYSWSEEEETGLINLEAELTAQNNRWRQLREGYKNFSYEDNIRKQLNDDIIFIRKIKAARHLRNKRKLFLKQVRKNGGYCYKYGTIRRITKKIIKMVPIERDFIKTVCPRNKQTIYIDSFKEFVYVQYPAGYWVKKN